MPLTAAGATDARDVTTDAAARDVTTDAAARDVTTVAAAARDGVDTDYYEQFDVYEELRSVPRDVDFRQASISDVGQTLRLLKLHRFIAPFRANDVDGALLLELSKDDLKQEFGFSALETIKLWKFVHDGWRPKA